MKKFTKVCLILAGSFIFLGLVCFIIGGIKGGSLIDTVKRLSSDVIDYAKDFDKEIDREKMKLKKSVPIDEIEKLQVDIGYGAVVVQPVSGDSCHVLVQEREDSGWNEVEVSMENETLFIRDETFGKKNHFWNFDFFFNNHGLNFRKGCLVVVELPQKDLERFAAVIQAGACKLYDISADQMDVQVECGNMYGQGMQNTRSMNINVDMGNVTFERIRCKTLEAQVEMGNFDVFDIQAESANVEAEMGEINLKRVKTAYLEADCEMGDITLQMEGEPSDYWIDSEVEMGDIDIENRSSTKDKTAENKILKMIMISVNEKLVKVI